MIRIASVALAAVLVAPPVALPISARSRSVQPGELVILSIEGAGPITVRAFDHDVAAYPDGERAVRALVGIDLDVKPGNYAVTVEAGSGSARARGGYDLVVKPRVFRTRRLTV